MSIFREYDIRGIFGKDLTRDRVFAIGVFVGQRILSQGQRIVFVGFDARVHSQELLEWLGAGLEHGGVDVVEIGMVPTPVAYFCTYHEIDGICATSSIMITGSHNPPEYNGFKITIDRKPFYGSQIQSLRQEIESSNLVAIPRSRDRVCVDALSQYVAFLSTHFQSLENFPYAIALDYGNGVAGLGMERILENLGIHHQSLYANPDGTFPNHHPDPSEEKNLKDLKDLMRTQDLPIGLAFDGDGDRIALLTQNHHFKGDELGILFAKQIAQNKPNPLIIGEVKCSQVMYDAINAFGKGLMYKTGHSNLKVKLKELGADLAVEMSGHIFFHDRYYGYDDATYAGLRALELFVKKSPKELEDVIAQLPKVYATPEEKIPTTEEEKFEKIASLHQRLKNPPLGFPKIVEIIAIDGVRVVFEKGWGLVRASNTTPVLVTRFEAENEALAMEYKKALLKLLES
ncbi:phospho-sugar mutase [Helicobacter mustelae]|uniref:phosphomannomutase/phosphoglucomutase n=1 Tax=Helicobacter mustelae TaxID=217 RepID=UPI000E08A67A|nr:phosphomannomutase/phosphoglucomutase [Helicobacter mustelae]STP13292.1 phospho-sugar mutase [Helicobacter mustelae]